MAANKPDSIKGIASPLKQWLHGRVVKDASGNPELIESFFLRSGVLV